jgi:Xaa-Pro aminopeptidase
MKRDRRTQDSIFMSLTETVKPITTDERQQRLARLQAAMASHELDAVIVTPGANMRYFFGLTWRETERLVCAVTSKDGVVFVWTGSCAVKRNTVNTDIGWRSIPIPQRPKVRDRNCAASGR